MRRVLEWVRQASVDWYSWSWAGIGALLIGLGVVGILLAAA